MRPSPNEGEFAPGDEVPQLERLVGWFASIDQITESAFLAIGNRVETFHRQAEEISASALHTIRLLEGETGEHALMRLQLLVERCRLWLDEAQTQMEQVVALLIEVAAGLSGMSGPIRELRKLSKILQNLRVSTRIETSRALGAGAQVLADDLKRMVDLVNQQLAEIGEAFSTLEALSGQALKDEQHLGSGAIDIARTGIQESRLSLETLSRQRLETEHCTEGVQRQSDKVAGHFGEIIVALQFQDITRQRMDHIREALGELLDQVRPSTETPPQTPQLCRDERTLLVADVCRLQHDHLEATMAEFDEAVARLTVNLADVTSSIHALAAQAHQFEASDALDAEHGVLHGARLLQQVTAQLQKVLTLNRDAGSTVRTVCRKVADITGKIDAVEYIGEEMQLMALNAAINAAHCRREGAGLQVIAAQIQKLSEASFTQTVTLAGACRVIAEQADELERLDEDGCQLELRLSELVSEGDDLYEMLQNNCRDLASRTQHLSAEVERFEHGVIACLDSIEVREMFQREVAPLRDALRRLSGDVKSASGWEGSSRSHLFRKIRSQYTMRSERVVHDGYIDTPGKGAETVVEVKTAASGRDDGLGENVELF